jgi:hypothetical protein
MHLRLALFLTAAALSAPAALAQEAGALRPAIAPADDAAPPVVRRAPPPQADPYAPLGIRAGGFLLYPSLTIGTGYTSNAAGVAGSHGSGTATVTPELLIQSDWARHEATLKLRGSYETFFDDTTDDNPSAAVDATGRLDLAGGWAVNLAAGYAFREQALSDPDFPLGADKPPGVHELNSSVALSGGAGRVKVTAEGTVDRFIYEDAVSGGVPVDQGYRTNTEFGGRLRLGYEATATLTPFVEGEVTRRVYDRKRDNNNIERAGTGFAGRAGVALDRGPVLTGEIAVGAISENFDDASLATLSALAVDGSLVWSPTELVTVSFDGRTSLAPSTNPASSGSVIHDGALDLAYAWRRNVTLHATGAVKNERFQGVDARETTYQAGLSATWKLNRTAWLTAGYLHEWFDSSDATRNYESDAVRVQLRLQH